MGTKAETLQRLQAIVTKSKIPDQKCFSVADWKDDSDFIVQDLSECFGGKKSSSAVVLAEDASILRMQEHLKHTRCRLSLNRGPRKRDWAGNIILLEPGR